MFKVIQRFINAIFFINQTAGLVQTRKNKIPWLFQTQKFEIPEFPPHLLKVLITISDKTTTEVPYSCLRQLCYFLK